MNSTPANEVTIPPKFGGIDAASTVRKPVLASPRSKSQFTPRSQSKDKTQSTVAGGPPDNRVEYHELDSMHCLVLGTAAHAALVQRPRNPGRTSLPQIGQTVRHNIQRQSALSGTSVPSTVPTPLPRSESVNTRQVPPARTSAGRKRDLYAILRLSGTQ
jgi:hypothetical protein